MGRATACGPRAARGCCCCCCCAAACGRRRKIRVSLRALRRRRRLQTATPRSLHDASRRKAASTRCCRRRSSTPCGAPCSWWTAPLFVCFLSGECAREKGEANFVEPKGHRASERDFRNLLRSQLSSSLSLSLSPNRGTQLLSGSLFLDADAPKSQHSLDIEQEKGAKGAIKGCPLARVLMRLPSSRLGSRSSLLFDLVPWRSLLSKKKTSLAAASPSSLLCPT